MTSINGGPESGFEIAYTGGCNHSVEMTGDLLPMTKVAQIYFPGVLAPRVTPFA